ncbi:ATP-binding protein [Xanthobacter pseudotagetidis]|uniref:ATP-binding protein n=1 Tax=Xanthobacter pseudotagetidis TaxID=3119911 RepID=UPI0037292FB7
MIPLPAAGTLLSELRIGASIDEIARATSWLGALAEAGDWPQSVRFGLELSLEEALTNVVSYGFAGVDHAPDIRIECWRTPQGRIAVRIRDNGVAFDPTQIAEPEVPASIEEAKIGGHGVQLMRNFLESLSYERAGGENRLTLVGKADEG